MSENMKENVEIQVGEIFTIGNTPTYPKLKTSYGYIDIRDEIKKYDEIEFPVRLMTEEEIAIAFYGATIKKAKESVSHLLNK